MRHLLLCIVFGIGCPAFAQEYATVTPTPLYETVQPVPLRVRTVSVAAPQVQSSGYRAVSYEWHLTSGESAEALRQHMAVPQPEHHGAYFNRTWLNQLSFNELVGLHSDAHNGRVQWQYVNGGAPAAKKEQPRAPGPVGTFFRAILPPVVYGNCPNGMCPKGR